MRRKIVALVLILLVFVQVGLFATWGIGDYVDDFNDPTGEHFLYSVTNGTFSNSVTKNSASPMRVLIAINKEEFPFATVTFEPHAYSWNNSVERFYSNSVAYIKFKDDSGNVVSFRKKNSEYSRNWNLLNGEDAIKVINLFRENKTIKVSIQIETYSFNYVIDCSDFEEVYDNFVPSFSVEKNKWILSYSEDSLNGYDWAVAKIYFDTNIKGKPFIADMYIMGNPSKPDAFPYIHLSLYSEDEDSGLYFSTDSWIGSSKEIEYNKVIFTVGEKSYTVKGNYSSNMLRLTIAEKSSYHWNVESTKLYELLKSGSEVTIDIYTDDGDTISLTTSSAEFLKYITYPYDF